MIDYSQAHSIINNTLSEDKTHQLIDAAASHADAYDDDDRQDIKTDVINSFYKGAHWMLKNLP